MSANVQGPLWATVFSHLAWQYILQQMVARNHPLNNICTQMVPCWVYINLWVYDPAKFKIFWPLESVQDSEPVSIWHWDQINNQTRRKISIYDRENLYKT